MGSGLYDRLKGSGKMSDQIQESRIFKVYIKTNDEMVDVVGVTELAKLLNCEVGNIPPIRIYKVSYNDFVITEPVTE